MRFGCAWAVFICAAAACVVRAQLDGDGEQELQGRDINVAAIVGVRNVELSIKPFLMLLAPFVNFTVLLDDSSTDGTVAAIESVAQEAKVRRVLVKDGSWNRSETTDRNELLLAGAPSCQQSLACPRFAQDAASALRILSPSTRTR
jgi:hypothetical protein